MGMQVTYKHPDKGWVNEQYIGAYNTPDDNYWVNDNYWEQIPNQAQLKEINENLSFSKDFNLNSIFSYIAVYGRELKESDVIKWKLFGNYGSVLNINGTDGVAKNIQSIWNVGELCHVDYTVSGNTVSVDFVPTAAIIGTDYIELNNQVVLKNWKLIPIPEDMSLFVDNATLSNFIDEFFIFGTKEDDIIKFQVWANGGSALTINGESQGSHAFGTAYEANKIYEYTYNNYRVIFRVVKTGAQTSGTLNSKIATDISYAPHIAAYLIENNYDTINGILYVPPFYPNTKKSEYIREVCNDMAIPVIDQNRCSGITVYNGSVYYSDTVHPNNIGKPLTASYIASCILPILKAAGIENPKFACMGDSITSNQVTNIGDLVRQKINGVYLQESEKDSDENVGNITTEFGNLACGWAKMCDVWSNGENTTPYRLLKSPNTGEAYNVLSNQVLRLAQHTTALGEQVIITAPDGTSIEIPTELGTGKGYTDDKPDVIYIAISTNDSWSYVGENDWLTVREQKFNELKRNTIPSALRWAIIALQSLYPSAFIFVCTPLQKIESIVTE